MKINKVAWFRGAVTMILMATFLVVSGTAEAQRGRRGAPAGGAVEIAVTVVDRDGAPVRGLTASDFSVTAARRSVDITGFEAVELLPDSAVGAQPLTFVVVVDVQRLGDAAAARETLGHLQRVIREDMPPGTMAMVVSQQRGLRVRQDLTGNLEAAAAALDALKGEVGEVGLVEAEVRRLQDALRDQTTPMELQRTYHSIQAFARDQRAQAVSTARNLVNLMDGLAGVPGRKVMVYMGEGLTLRPAESLFRAYEMALAAMGSRGDFSSTMAAEAESAVSEYETLVRHANSAGVTIYPLVPQGEGETLAGRHAPGRAHPSTSSEWLNQQAGFVMLADGTGGRILIGGADALAKEERLAAEFRFWYVLGFSSDRLMRSYRALRVEANCAGCTVRHPGGIQARPLEDVLQGRLAAVLSLGVGANPWGMVVRPHGEQKAGRRSVEVPLLVNLPLSEVSFTAAGDTHDGHLTFIVGTMDGHGQLSDPETFELPLSIPAAQFAGAQRQALGYPVTLQTQPGRRTVGILVFDRQSGVSAVATVEMEVMDRP